MSVKKLPKINTVTPLEHLFFADEGKLHPMCFFLKVRVEGIPDRVKIDNALRAALRRHPMLRATIAGDAKNKTSALNWVVSDDTGNMKSIWNPKVIAPIRINEESGVRLYVRDQDETDRQMLFQFHHSCTDARGAVQFIEDVLTCYAGLENTLIELEPDLLALRSDLRREDVSHKMNLLRYFEQFAGFYLQKCAPIKSKTLATGEYNPAAWPCTFHRSFDQTEFRRLKSRTIQKHCTINDLILRDVMIALAGWNQRHGVNANVRIGMPINMRTATQGRMPAANYVSMCNIERAPDQMKDSWQLLGSISRETAYIKSNRLGYAFLLLVGTFSKIRGGMQSLLSHKKSDVSLVTAVVSNLGDVFRYSLFGKPQDGYHLAGDLKILDVSLVPAVRPGTKVAFGVVTCLRRMTLSMQYDQMALSPDDAQSIFESVNERLAETIGTGAITGEDLDTLISRHKNIGGEKPGFRSLPLGKHVTTSARLELTEGKPGHGSFVQMQ